MMKYRDVSELLATELTTEESPATHQLMQDLERDFATEGEVLRPINDTHPSGADPVENAVARGERGTHLPPC